MVDLNHNALYQNGFSAYFKSLLETNEVRRK